MFKSGTFREMIVHCCGYQCTVFRSLDISWFITFAFVSKHLFWAFGKRNVCSTINCNEPINIYGSIERIFIQIAFMNPVLLYVRQSYAVSKVDERTNRKTGAHIKVNAWITIWSRKKNREKCRMEKKNEEAMEKRKKKIQICLKSVLFLLGS